MEKFNSALLREIIKKFDISIDDLALKSNIKRATLYNYLNGSTPITVEAILKLSNILELKNPELFNENVLMNVLMNVPLDVLMRSEEEHNKELEQVLRRQIGNLHVKEVEDLKKTIETLNKTIESKNQDISRLISLNAHLQGEIEDCKGSHGKTGTNG